MSFKFSEDFLVEFLKVYQHFISPSCNRLEFIQKYLLKYGVETAVIPIDGKKHIFVKFDSSAYSPMFKMKTVIAHYDRVSGSPGANDNSSSVISLIFFAIRLKKFRGVHNMRIFFTDGEELEEFRDDSENQQNFQNNPQKSAVTQMGAFGLATLFKKLGIVNDDVYVFDCTGRGTVPVLGETTFSASVPKPFVNQYKNLEERTKDLIKSVSPYFMMLPVAYSDNAGFLICRIPAVVITFLPSDEASIYARNLLKYKELKKFVTCKKIPSFEKLSEERRIFEESKLKALFPITWQLFHKSTDNFQSLTLESFELCAKILDKLAETKSLS